MSHSTTKSIQIIQLQNPFRPFNYKIPSDHSTTKSTRDNQQLNPSRLTCSLTHYLPPLFIPSLTLSLPCSFGVSLTCTVAHYLTIPLAPLLAPSQSLSHSCTHLHSHALTHSLMHSCTHSLVYSLMCFPAFIHALLHIHAFTLMSVAQSP